ncbi:MAG: hypothetical protein E7584_00630 [Ruminococcaceae bacterium]|nr:hypothetical protein [Oscillospiraceae bacterium]
MENENMIIEEAVVAEGEEIIIEEAPADAIDVVVEEEADASTEPVEEIVGEIADEEAEEEVATEESATERLSRKCEEVKAACCSTIDRIVYDLKETNFNPYIKQTRITRVEIYRNCNEEQPIDTFETTDVKSYSAKALLVAGVATALLVAASGKLVKKFLK